MVKIPAAPEDSEIGFLFVLEDRESLADQTHHLTTKNQTPKSVAPAAFVTDAYISA